MNRETLEGPFPQSTRKTRQGPFGKELQYVEAQHYIRRLNDAFGSAWSWRLLHHDIQGNEVVVIGALEAEGIIKHSFGGSTVTTNKQTGEVVSVANDLKAAATDALKKACSLFGVGLELHGGVPNAEHAQRETARAQVTNETAASSDHSPNGSTRPHAGGRRPDSSERNRLTDKQLNALYAISHTRQMSERELKETAIDAFGVSPELLTRQQASSLIDSLNGH